MKISKTLLVITLLVVSRLIFKGCWPRLCPCHVGFSIEHLKTWQLNSLQQISNRTRKCQQDKSHSSYNLIIKMTFHYFYFTLFIRRNSLDLAHMQGEVTLGEFIKRQISLKVISEAANQPQSSLVIYSFHSWEVCEVIPMAFTVDAEYNRIICQKKVFRRFENVYEKMIKRHGRYSKKN